MIILRINSNSIQAIVVRVRWLWDGFMGCDFCCGFLF